MVEMLRPVCTSAPTITAGGGWSPGGKPEEKLVVTREGRHPVWLPYRNA